MTPITCPECAAQISDQAAVCPSCGREVKLTRPTEPAPIHRMGGKLQAIGTVVVAGGLIATVAGTWWGPALLLPGAVIFIIGRFL